MYLTCYSFGGQWIATDDAIQDIMYAFTQENGHIVWKEWWYIVISRVSLQTDLYKT
jgi:hypothetical protein